MGQASEYSDFFSFFECINRTDLLLGRGGETNSHNGNILFRRMIEQHKAIYLAAPRRHKPQIAMALVAKWKALDPPGRFLTKSKSSQHWYEIDDETAKKRTSKSLGERKGMHPSTSSSIGGHGGGSSGGGSGGSLSDSSATKGRQRITASPASAAPTASSTASRKSSSNSQQDVTGLKRQQQHPETPPQAPSLSGHLFNNQAGTLTGGDAFEGYTLDRAATSPEIMTRMLLLQQQQQHHIESNQPLRQQPHEQDWPLPLHHHEVSQRLEQQQQKQQSPTSKDELDAFITSSVGAFNMGNHPQHGAAAGVGERGSWDTNNYDTEGNLQQRPLSMENIRHFLPTAEELTRSCFEDDD